MFYPEFTITPDILKNVANIEYAKAIVDSTVVLPHWEQQLIAQTKVDFTMSNFYFENINCSHEQVKRVFNKFEKAATQEMINFETALDKIDATFKNAEITEEDLKYFYKVLTQGSLLTKGQVSYRSKNLPDVIESPNILAETVELLDWLHSIEAKIAHPIIVAGIVKARLEQIVPFEYMNTSVVNLLVHMLLHATGYEFKGYLGLVTYYSKGPSEYLKNIKKLRTEKDHALDYTQWLEYFTMGISMETATLQEKIKLLAKDTKIAKASGRADLTPRQETIVEYLQDYGLLKNRDFAKLFPKKSEDSILRDLKVLTDKGIVKKVGSTKSSRYELV